MNGHKSLTEREIKSVLSNSAFCRLRQGVFDAYSDARNQAFSINNWFGRSFSARALAQ